MKTTKAYAHVDENKPFPQVYVDRSFNKRLRRVRIIRECDYQRLLKAAKKGSFNG